MADLQRGTGEEIKLKRYFYASRAAMALRWIETREDLPPMNFRELITGLDIPKVVFAEIDRLLDIKTSMAELGTGPRISALEDFLSKQIKWASAHTSTSPDIETHLDARRRGDHLFREIIG